ncbi:MAG: protein translocase subunit SecF [Treponema sp.]|jgi:preprotein translocase subunit SecF|nr:protein translocase subunit SecF [Treponema sp.]
MKTIIPFTRFFIPATVLSVVLIIAGIAGYIVWGFNLGIDFQAGLIQEVQLAPRAFSLAYTGPGNAVVSLNNTSLTVAVSGAGIRGATYEYLLADYETVGTFAQALDQMEGISAVSAVPGATPFRHLALDAQSAPALGPEPYWVHYLPREASPVQLETIREALAGFGEPSVQVLGDVSERRFLIRLQDTDIQPGFQTTDIAAVLDRRLGEGETAVTSSNYVGSRFSKTLADQAGWLLAATLVLILLYASVRFRPQYAIGAVLAIVHDALIMVAFIVWTRMEFNTTTIAAILTILGYSINDTIVIFDRVRETRRIYPNDDFKTVLNRSITETLSRTFITTLTTMLAVLSLYIFTGGSMKDFALALLVGLVSGVYSTIFIANGFVYLWEMKFKQKPAQIPAEAGA